MQLGGASEHRGSNVPYVGHGLLNCPYGSCFTSGKDNCASNPLELGEGATLKKSVSHTENTGGPCYQG